MGFWSRVGSFVGSAVSTVGRVIGSKTLETIGNNIQDFCSDVGKSSSYNKNTASAADTASVNELLTVFSSKLKDQADELETNVLNDVREYFEDIIIKIEDSGKNIQTKQFRHAMTQTERSIKGKLKAYLAKRVSIDDNECLNILALDPSNDKTQKMDNFGRKVLKEGLNQLSKQIEETVSKYNKELQYLLNQLLEQQEKGLKQVHQQFNEILQQANGEIVDKEAAKLKPAILLKSVEQLEKTVS